MLNSNTANGKFYIEYCSLDEDTLNHKVIQNVSSIFFSFHTGLKKKKKANNTASLHSHLQDCSYIGGFNKLRCVWSRVCNKETQCNVCLCKGSEKIDERGGEETNVPMYVRGQGVEWAHVCVYYECRIQHACVYSCISAKVCMLAIFFTPISLYVCVMD